MALRRLGLVVSAMVLTACSAQADMAFKQQSEIKLFQHYAQASCLATAFTEGEIYDQAISALNGYREFGSMPLEAYQELAEPMQQWLKKDYATQAGQQNNLMKCIDFAESEIIAKIYHRNIVEQVERKTKQ